MRSNVFFPAIGLLVMLAGTAHADATSPPPAPASAPAPGLTSTASPVFDSPGLRGPTLWGMLPWGGYGIGGRMMFPLPIQGVVHSPSVHDTFALEVGADLLHWSYDYGFVAGSYNWTEVLAVGGFMWNFWFSNQFALYPKIDLGYAFGWFSGWNQTGPQPTYGGFFVSGDVGAIYKLTNGLSLRAEVGSANLKVGVAWLF